MLLSQIQSRLTILNVLLTLVVGLAACSVAPATPTPNWQTRWLQAIPCAPPCWEGITPGQTSAEDALKKLQANPLVASAELISKYGAVAWKWKNGENGGAISFHNATDQPIDRVNPYLPPVRLSEVIHAYGEPSHIQAYAVVGVDIGSGVDYGLYLIYDTRGMVLEVPPTQSLREKPPISADMLVNVHFFAPSPEGLDHVPNETLQVANHDFIVPWQGIRDFDFYCKDDLNGKICRGEWKGY